MPDQRTFKFYKKKFIRRKKYKMKGILNGYKRFCKTKNKMRIDKNRKKIFKKII